MRRHINRGAAIQIMEVVERYQIEGSPECTLIDRAGNIYEGCSIMALGGDSQVITSCPDLDSEVLTVTEPHSRPYIIGTLPSLRQYISDDIQLNNAGEYPSQEIDLNDIALKRGAVRLIAGEFALHLMPKVRVQGRLEVSDGAAPAQSAAVAEPLLATLNEYHSVIETLRQIVVTDLAPLAIASYTTAGDAAAITALTGRLAGISSALALPHATIASELSKVER